MARLMMCLKYIVGVISACFLFILQIEGHPQCIDSRPPFMRGASEIFCTDYSLFACCTTNMDQELSEKYTEIVQNNKTNGISVMCQQYLRDLLCQTCSPYSAHIYDAEATMLPRSFPGLCSDYCLALYNDCKDIVSLAYNDTSLLSSLVSANEFCDHTSLTDVDYCYPGLLTHPVLTRQVAPVTVNTQGCLCVEEIVAGLRNPLVAQHAGDNSGRLFIVEQIGLVHIMLPNRTILNEPFFDLTKSILTSNAEGDERGFLGLAFHPNFKINKRFFVFYSIGQESDIGDHMTRISEFRESEDDINHADQTERVILQVEEPYSNHNGGELLFGDDGYLYIFLGDGGAGGDPLGSGQNKSSLLGKVLRIDVDMISAGLQYAIPPDNPFLHEPDTRDEIYAYGVRNMWRCGKDPGDADGKDRGRIICGDVGQSAFEELDLLIKGANYGWNSREGFECFDRNTCGKIGPEVLPIHAYNHRVGKSVTGGKFYRGCESPNLDGLYIYGDYITGRLFGLSDNNGVWENKELFMCTPDICLNLLQSTYEMSILSFGQDEQGEVYMLSTSNASPHSPSGKVYKIVDPARRGNPELCSRGRQQANGREDTASRITTVIPKSDVNSAHTKTTRTNEHPKSSYITEKVPVLESGSTGMLKRSFAKLNMLIIAWVVIPQVIRSMYHV